MLQNVIISMLIRRVLPVLAGALGALLVEHGILDQETVQAISQALGG